MPNSHQRHLDIVDNRRKSVRAWQDRIRNPSLTALLVLELCALFLAAPLAAKGLPIARVVADALLLGVVVIVVMLSLRWVPLSWCCWGWQGSRRASCRARSGQRLQASCFAAAATFSPSPR